MTTRIRTRESTVADGLQNIGGTIQARGSTVYFKQNATDVVDKKVDERGMLPATPCSLYKFRAEWTPVNYQGSSTAPGLRWLKGARPALSSSFGSVPFPSTLNAAGAVTLLLSRTNPFRQEVDVPVMLVEFITLMGLLNTIKGSIVNVGASFFLTKEFEIDPFMSDMKSLDNILQILESRIREYNSLFGKGGLHRRVKLHSNSDVLYVGNTAIHTSPVPTSVWGSTRTRRRITWYGSVRWYPRHGILPQPDPIVRVRAILREIMGMNPRNHGWSQLWELIPFSFLMDYFVNLNDLLGSAKGRQFVVPRYISVSKVTEDVKVITPTSYGLGSSGGYARLVQSSLERTVYPDGYVGDAVFNCLLSWGQLSNLTALIAAMQKRI